MRPLFLTRTRRVMRVIPQLLALATVLGLFIGLGLLVGYGISQ